MSFCTSCGAELHEKDEFCPKCGQATHEPEKKETGAAPGPPPIETASQATAVPSDSKRRLSGCAIAAIIGGSVFGLMALLGVVVLVVAFAATSPAVEAVEDHLAALKQGEIEEAYAGTAADFQQSNPLEGYRQFVTAHPILGDVVDSSFTSREVENGIALIKGTIRDSADHEEEFHVRLVNVGDDWKILGINLPNVTPVLSEKASDSSVGEIIIGAGRNPDGSLVNPGAPLSTQTAMLCASVELINHPVDETVEVFIRQGENRTASIVATDLMEGTFYMPADIEIREANFPPGDYEFVVMLGGQATFAKAFKIQ